MATTNSGFGITTPFWLGALLMCCSFPILFGPLARTIREALEAMKPLSAQDELQSVTERNITFSSMREDTPPDQKPWIQYSNIDTPRRSTSVNVWMSSRRRKTRTRSVFD